MKGESMNIKHVLKNGKEVRSIKGHKLNQEKSRTIANLMKEVSRIEKKNV